MAPTADAGSPPPAPSRRERRRQAAERPASVAQLRSLRRWLVVAGVWAVAATAIAVFALIQADREDEAARDQASGQLGRAERRLNDRIDELDERVDGLPSSEEVGGLGQRLGEAEQDAGTAAERLETLSGRVGDIERQVDDLAEPSADEDAGAQTTP